MTIISFITETEYDVVDRIIDHLKFRFVADKPSPSHVFEQVALMAAEENTEHVLPPPLIAVLLTSPRGRIYIASGGKRRDSWAGVAISRAAKKAISYQVSSVT